MSLLRFLFLVNVAHCKLWVKQNIGEVTDLYYNQKLTKGYVSTKQGVIASIDLEDQGNIIWRQVLHRNDNINQFEVSLDHKALFSLSNGNVLRKWKKMDGSLLWESAQFRNDNHDTSDSQPHMQVIENDKIVLLDSAEELSLFDAIEGTLIWSQSIRNASKLSKVYTDQTSKIIYVIMFAKESVLIHSYSLVTGQFIDQSSNSNEYRHKCLSVPSNFEMFAVDHGQSVMVLYDCDTVFAALLFAPETSQMTQVLIDTSLPQILIANVKNWKLWNKKGVVYVSTQGCQLYEIGVTLSLVSLSKYVHLERERCMYIWKESAHETVLSTDGSLCFYKNNNERKQWCREEALSLPLFVYLFDESNDESSNEKAFKAPFPSFAQRLVTDLSHISEMSLNINIGSNKWLEATFEKAVIILTEYGKLFGLSSAQGNVLWSVDLKGLCGDGDGNGNGYEVISLLMIRQHSPHFVAILSNPDTKSSKIMSILSPFHSAQQTPKISVETVAYYVKNAFMTPFVDAESNDKRIALIDENNRLINSGNESNLYYHTISVKEETLSGYRDATMTWQKSFADSRERMIDFVFSLRDQLIVNSVYRTGERGSIYKYLNPHLMGVATVAMAESVLHIYLIDGITGKIHFHTYHSHCGSPETVSLLLYENKFIYAFFNSLSLLSEIHSIDLWQSNPALVPNKGRSAAEGYIVSDNPLGTDNVFSSMFHSGLPYVTSQSYNFRLSIDALLCVSNTRYSVSNKLLLVRLSSGGIVQIDAKWLNTRRPITHEPTQANKEEQLIAYKKHIPFNSLWSLSHSHTLNRINHAVSVGSPIESTSLVFAYGDLDLFFTLIKPSKNFDTIPSDFDYAMLALILSGVVVAIVVAKKMAQSKKIKKEWK